MNVLLATHLGLCFGVRDALETARSLESPTTITVRGQLVHNPVVTHELAHRGFALQPEHASTSANTPRVLITAHGISHADRHHLLAQGKTLIDTTCPLVRKAHDAALALHADNRHVLLIARKNHIETRGLTGDLHHFTVLESEADVLTFPHPRLGILSQTTAVDDHVQKMTALVRAKNPHADLRIINTTCQPTRDRQLALEDLLPKVDLLVVLGGRNSHNTLQLVARAHAHHLPALHIEHPDELSESQFTPHQTVGLTAGTSTLPETIAAVHHRLLHFHRSTPCPR